MRHQVLFDSLWTYAFVSPTTSERFLWRANRGAKNHIVVRKDELIPRRVTRVRDLFEEQRVRSPIELPLKQIGNAHFCTDEIVHKKLQTLYRQDTQSDEDDGQYFWK